MDKASWFCCSPTCVKEQCECPACFWIPRLISSPSLLSTGQADNGACLSYWPGERWLAVRSPVVRSILEDRIKASGHSSTGASDKSQQHTKGGG